MTNVTVDLIEEIDVTKFWRQQVAERHPADFRNQQTIDILAKLQVELEKLGDEELEQVLELFDDRTVEEPVIPELLKKVGFSWRPQVREFVEHVKNELVRAANA